MKTLDAIAALIPTLAGRIGAGMGASEVQAVVEGLDDAGAVAVLREAGEVGRLVEQMQVICAGVTARRSTREVGHAGLAQARGHRSSASLVQELGGMSKGEAARQVRVGEALLYDALVDGADPDPPEGGPLNEPVARERRQVLREGLRSVAVTEDGLHTLPATVAERHICETGTIPVTIDTSGNPLDVGRESRLFTPTQHIALAVRDHGCRWTGCNKPASYCEAHHIDEWAHDHGHTNIDQGILLCRFHHMQLHHRPWHITRHQKHDLDPHHPNGEQNMLPPQLPLRHA